MVSGAHFFRLVCLGVLLSVSGLPAKELAAYHAGDIAGESISTPVALDVIDADATAARKAAQALKTPAIFRSYPNPTNAMVNDFLAAFEKTRGLFATNLQSAFGDITNADELIASPGFAKFVTTFNRKTIPFPISTELAGIWAQGAADAEMQTRLVNALLAMTHRPIRPDDLTNGIALGETLRLAAVESPQEELTLADAEQRGKLVTLTSVTTVTRLRDLFRRNFPQPEQAMARGIGKFLLTNCEIDAGLTQQARDRDTRQLVVVNHYDAGQVIVQRGEIIDGKTKAALVLLNEKMVPSRLDAQLAVQREQLRVQLENTAAQKARDQKINLQNQEQTVRVRNEWLLIALAGISVGVLAVLWIRARHRRRSSSLPLVRAEKLPPSPHELLPAGLAPQLTQILKEAVVQGLAAQRSELLQAQQIAAAEIGALVHRLDELKAPMQDRLRSYEERIVGLEKDLAERNEENRELLKLKIEMTRRQLEAERARNRVDFN